MKRLKSLLLAITLLCVLAGQVIVPSLAFACSGDGSGSSKDQVLTGVGSTGSDCSENGFNHTVSAAVTILSYVVGIAAIIMIVLAGLKFITSGGDASKAGSAKSTLTYALIGLAVAALAQFLVHFVINTATTTPCSTNSQLSASDPKC